MPRSAPAAVGARIKRLREQADLSQAELAERIGKTQTAISLWEQGRRVPDLVDLVELADSLAVDVTAFFPERQRPRMLLRAQIDRLLIDDLPDEVEAFIAEVEEEPAPESGLRITNDSPIGAAQELLAIAGISKAPIPVEELARGCGVRVRGFSFGPGVSGLLIELDSGPVIGFRESDSIGRQRFSVAHELGHYLLRHYDNFHIDLEAMAVLGNPPGYDWRDERSANEFAAQLLMPAALVTKAHSRAKNLVVLADLFEVSQEAMSWRLVNLGLR